MEWFKFYGKDWLTDIKTIQMRVEDRLCYITLLCLASCSEEQGVVEGCTEEALISLTHLKDNPYDDDNEYSRASGCLSRFEAKKMITIDNETGVIIVNNFHKRQALAMSGYERVKKWRKKQMITDGNADNDDSKGNNQDYDNAVITDDNENDNGRIDKNRIDNNIAFSVFWDAYQKKKDRPKCEKKWNKLSLAEQTAVLEYIPKYLATIKDKQFQKYPATFLNNRSWENDIDEKQPDYSTWSDFRLLEEKIRIQKEKEAGRMTKFPQEITDELNKRFSF